MKKMPNFTLNFNLRKCLHQQWIFPGYGYGYLSGLTCYELQLLESPKKSITPSFKFRVLIWIAERKWREIVERGLLLVWWKSISFAKLLCYWNLQKNMYYSIPVFDVRRLIRYHFHSTNLIHTWTGLYQLLLFWSSLNLHWVFIKSIIPSSDTLRLRRISEVEVKKTLIWCKIL